MKLIAQDLNLKFNCLDICLTDRNASFFFTKSKEGRSGILDRIEVNFFYSEKIKKKK